MLLHAHSEAHITCWLLYDTHDHINTHCTMSHLSCRYAEAERRFREAVAEARLGFPPGDPHIPSALHYLAELYRNTRRYAEAQPLYEEVRGVRACCWA
jgi:hypothetical protein